MNDQSLQKIKDALSKSTNIGVVVGRDPSVDEMAATLSLYLLLRGTNKKVSVASPTDPIVELSSLVGIDKVQRSLGGESDDLVVSFPYVEGEIEKVSYTLEEGFLNIIVKASEQGLSFDEKDVRYVRGSGTVDLLFVIGTPRLSDLEDVFDAQKLRDVKIINIDNKEANQGYGDIVMVSPKFSSVSEQVADIALALGFQPNQDVSQNLLSGIMAATKNFQNPNTSPVAFELAALLIKRGARRVSEQKSERAHDSSWLDEVARDQQAKSAKEDVRQPRESASGSGRDEEDAPVSGAGVRQPHPQQRHDQNRQRFQDQKVRDDSQQRRQDGKHPSQNQDQDIAASDSDDQGAPLDWLTPKVYKGSSDVE